MNLTTNDGGRLGSLPHEQLDCTVRAFAIALGVPYTEAHTVMANMGRRNGHRMSTHYFRIALNQYARRTGRLRRAGDTGITLGRYAKEHSGGRYILDVRGHALAMIDGVVHDTVVPKPRQIVLHAWRVVEEQSTCPIDPSKEGVS